MLYLLSAKASVLNRIVACAAALVVCNATATTATDAENRPVPSLFERILGQLREDSSGGFQYVVNGEPLNGEIRVDVYNSRDGEHGDYDENCVAFAVQRRIVCDLALIDGLIDDLKLVEIFGDSSSDYYRVQIGKWILGHEIGHIVLKHGISHYGDPRSGFTVFDAANQARELEADAFAISIVGKLGEKDNDAYAALIDMTNSLLRRAICPETFPDVCSKMPAGVGLIYDYTDTAEPIKIQVRGSHPEYIARFLRLLYLSGKNTGNNDVNYQAQSIIEHLLVERSRGVWESLASVFE
jgi:hypothetical protein